MNKMAMVLIVFLSVVAFSLSEKIFMVGFGSSTCDSSFEELVSKGFAGIIFYTRNMRDAESVKRLTECARKSGVKFIAIDHEGTFINRFRHIDGFIPPNAMALGSANDPTLAYLSGYYSAITLKELGFNMDLAPVLDVNSNPYNPVIGVRSFWSTPERVARIGIAFMKGLLDGGVIPVIKHFPGHGDTSVDSHTGLPVIDEDFETFYRTHVYPFSKAIGEGAPAVMTAHIIVKSWDRSPATLSEWIIGYLKKRMCFKGMVMSDDMMMKAVWIYAKENGIDPIVEAFRAGVDLILVSDPERAIEFSKKLDEAIEKGYVKRPIEDALVRINRTLNSIEKKEIKPSMTPEEVLDQVARRSIAAWDGRPLKVGDRILLLYPTNFIAPPKNYKETIKNLKFQLEFRGLYVDVESFDVKDPNIFVSNDYDAVLLLSVDLNRYESERIFVGKILRNFKRVILVAIRSPYDIMYVKPHPDRYVVTYDWNEHYPKYLASILTGEMKALGEFVAKELGGM